MTKHDNQIKLNELRDDSVNPNEEVKLSKTVLGGYNTKEVEEYINSLKDRLYNAENSFRKKIEENAEMTAMLTQERDRYLKMFNDIEVATREIKENANKLAEENKKLNFRITEFESNTITPEDIKLYEEIAQQNIIMQKKLDEYEIMTSENEVIKHHFDKLTAESSRLLVERDTLEEHNKILSESLQEANRKNKELRNSNTKTELDTRKIISEYEARVFMYDQNHKKNIEQIRENLKSALDTLSFETISVSKIACAENNIENGTELSKCG